MNAKISQDVIRDLLPVYYAGEVSADTRTLIETYLQQDATFAAEVQQETKNLLDPKITPPRSRDPELEALRKTKRILRRRAWHLAFAIFFTLTAVSYQFGPQGFKWTWQDAPFVSVMLGCVGLFFWAVYINSKRRLRITGL